MNCQLLHGDCLELMKALPDGSVDAVICDLPYGTTACAWDVVIPFEPLWAEYKRITKPNAAIVLTASQPFTSALVMSNPTMFRCEWIWDKVSAANFLNANRQPMKSHENVLVFAKSQPNYYPIKTAGSINHTQGSKLGENKSAMRQTVDRVPSDLSGFKFPKSIQTFAKYPAQGWVHTTQKPVELMEYLIRTYSNEGETVLDNCMGSGTTGVACVNTGRNFIGMELSEDYYNIARDRIENTQPLLQAVPA